MRTSQAANVPRLETPRLVLRSWCDSDIEGYARLIDDPEVMRYMGSGIRYRVKRAAASALARVSALEARRGIDRMVAQWMRCGFGEWAMEERASGALIGKVGLFLHSPDWVADPARIEIAWMLERSAWGNGYATEGARASLEHAFESQGIERVISVAKPENRRSVRVMERLGLAMQGRTRWRGNEVVWYAIDRSAWRGS
jgi:RimJ/RimL family protein N-acetyltransferase